MHPTQTTLQIIIFLIMATLSFNAFAVDRFAKAKQGLEMIADQTSKSRKDAYLYYMGIPFSEASGFYYCADVVGSLFQIADRYPGAIANERNRGDLCVKEVTDHQAQLQAKAIAEAKAHSKYVAEIKKLETTYSSTINKAIALTADFSNLPLPVKNTLKDGPCHIIFNLEPIFNSSDMSEKKQRLESLETATSECPEIINTELTTYNEDLKFSRLREKADKTLQLIEIVEADADSVSRHTGRQSLSEELAQVSNENCKAISRYKNVPSIAYRLLNDKEIDLCFLAVKDLRQKNSEVIASASSHQTNNAKQAQPKKYGDPVDAMTTFAVILGRAIGCGVDVEKPANKVAIWMDNTFSNKERATYLPVFAFGVEHHMKQQQSGKSPDSCRACSATIRMTG